MSDPGFSRRKQQLLDKFLAGEIDKATYDGLLADLHELGSAVSGTATSGPVAKSAGPFVADEPSSGVASFPSFVVTESRTSAERSALATPVALLEAGMELGGFQLRRRLRRGGMGEVWQAHDPTGERMVVIKVLPPELQRSPDEMSRVKQTFNRVHNLQHQHICPVYLLGQDPRFGYFIVMKYLDGDTLSAYRKAFVQRKGRFPLSEVVRVLVPIAKALDYAHGQQIIHRDIKPQNIMLQADGSDVQLVDFGLAAEVRTSVMRVSQVQMETCGTYPYMAPEQWRGEMQDARTDQYALAVVAFELLAGHLPFEATDATVLRMCVLNDAAPAITGVTDAVNAVIARGMSKSRVDRFDTCVAFMKALVAAVSAKTVADEIATLDESSVVSRPARPSTPAIPSTSRPIALSSSTPASSTPSSSVPARDARVPKPADTSSSRPKPGRPAAAGSASSLVPVRSPASRKPVDDDDLKDLEPLEPYDDAPIEPDDDRVSSRSGDRRRQQPSVRPVRGEVALERVNSRAMFWVFLIGGSFCTVFIGLFGWFLWGGMQTFFGPSTPGTPNSNSSQLAANPPVNGTAPATPNGAVPQPVPNPGPGIAAVPGVVPPVVPAVVPAVVPPADKNGQALRYRWEQGKQYVYSVKVELEPDPDVVVTVTGNTTYSRGQPVAKKNGAPDGKGQGTGTGFVVQADGYLITCQHVVDDASEIEVAIGGKKYPAKVVMEDVEHDLAIIRIDANGLPTLPLADSDKVQLGEEVRAIGFPFSSILGDNIKATRGTISGVNQDDDRKVFQVDAGINPGNSGGPLVNERGEVVGVNFAKLREEFATNVGFAVPVNDAINLLRSEGVAFANGDGKGPKLDGPDLVKRVSAATALITVNSGGGGAAAGNHHFELHCNGSLNSSVRSKSGKAVDPLAMQRSHVRSVMNRGFSQPDVVETDPLGHVHDITGDRSPLPALMGPLSMMVLEHLPSVRRPNWSHSFAISIVTSEESGDALGLPSRFRPRFRPPGFPGFPGVPGFPDAAPKTTRIPGKVHISYTLQEAVGDLVKIKKEFDLEARDKLAGEPRIKLTGSGVLSFDMKSGVPRSLDYTATLVENEKNTITKLPIKLTYQLVEERGAAGNIAQAPGAAMQPGKSVEKEMALPVGTRLVAEWAGKWLPVDVLQLMPNGNVRIHWVGWANQFDEEVARTRLRFPAGVNPPQPGAAPAAVAGVDPPVVATVPHEFTLKLSAAEIDQCLADLQGANAGQANAAAGKLQHAVPLDERRDEVLKALEAMLKQKDPFRRKQAVDALGTWAKRETIPLLIQCLEETALLVKLAAIEALGKLKDERAAEPLAKLVAEPGPRVQAAKALQSLGARAEKAVLGLLTHAEPEVRQEACRLLKEIGTAASLPALKTASEDTDRTVAASAKEAVAAISNRK